jgi:hypothetical protein
VPLLERALSIWEKARGPEHPDVAAALSGLGTLYGSVGRASEGEALLKRSLAIREKLQGPDHPGVASVLNADGVQFAYQTLTVAKLAGEFLSGKTGEYHLPNFPVYGDANDRFCVGGISGYWQADRIIVDYSGIIVDYLAASVKCGRALPTSRPNWSRSAIAAPVRPWFNVLAGASCPATGLRWLRDPAFRRINTPRNSL